MSTPWRNIAAIAWLCCSLTACGAPTHRVAEQTAPPPVSTPSAISTPPPVSTPIEPTSAAVTAEPFRSVPRATAKPQTASAVFSTPIVDRQKNRMKNLRLAASAIQGYVLRAGETFSFNEIVGPRSPQRGYRLGKIYVNGEKADEYGGGICQVATTVYNAALAAGFTVLERHRHHEEAVIPYVDAGKDATVFYGDLDLQFRNDGDTPALFNCTVKKWKVTVTVTVL